MTSQFLTPDRSPMVQVNIKRLIDDVQCSQTVRESLNLSASLLLDSGVLCSHVVREAQLILKALEKEGLQGGEHDKSRVGRHRHIHDPGIQQEPMSKLHVKA